MTSQDSLIGLAEGGQPPEWWPAWQGAVGCYGEALEQLATALEDRVDASGWDVREVMGSGHASGLRPLRALVMAGTASVDDIAAAAALMAPARRTNRVTVRLDPAEIDRSLVAAISEPVCRRLRAVPLGVEDGVLVVAEGESTPLLQAALNELVSACGASGARTVTAADGELAGALQFMAATTIDVGEAAAEGAEVGDAYPALVDTSGDHRLEGAAIQKMLSVASAWKSADIHMSTALDLVEGKRYLTVRLERLGRLVVHDKLPGEAGDRIMARIRAISKMKHDEVRPQDAAVTIVDPITGARTAIRIAAVPLVDGNQMMTLRLLPLMRRDLATLDTVFPPDITPVPLEVLKASLRRPDGLTLVTGPTSEGKSTTLAALINEVVDPSLKIVSAEQPVEYRIPGVDQVEIDESLGFGYPEAVEAFLRSAPKIIMVGEIRSPATAAAAIRAAETGHRVLSTMHVKSAAAAIARLRGLKIGVEEISSSLNLVVAQRLVGTLCHVCNQSDPKCKQCYGEGWGGRTAVMEALMLDDDLVELLSGPRPPTLPEIRKRQIFKFADHARALVEAGLTTAEETERVLGPAAFDEAYDLGDADREDLEDPADP